MTEIDDHDERFLTELSSLLRRADPVPDAMLEGAHVAFGWRRIDAELAELLSDSAYAGTEELAGATRSSGRARTIGYRGAGLSIDLEVRTDGPQPTMLGQLTPAGETEVELETAGARATRTTRTTRTDALGAFRFDLETLGTVRLRVLDRAGPAPRWIETGWIALR